MIQINCPYRVPHCYEPVPQLRETEAEAIAFVVSQTIGLDAGRASADYIHLYHGNAALLTESLEVIQRTSALILSAIETGQVEATTNTEGRMARRGRRTLQIFRIW